MKNNILLAALLVTSSCALAGPGGYVGVNAGSTQHNINFDGESGSDTSTGVKVYAGFQVTPAIGVEAGYVRFGEIDESDSEFSLSYKPNAFYAAVTGTMAISPGFDLIGKVGVARSDSKIAVSYLDMRASLKDDVVSALFGIGVQYKFSETMSVVAEYENYGKIAKYEEVDLTDKAALVSVGLRIAF